MPAVIPLEDCSKIMTVGVVDELLFVVVYFVCGNNFMLKLSYSNYSTAIKGLFDLVDLERMLIVPTKTNETRI